MSSSNSDREMLLSAALDGELSVQEQIEFDRLISNDPTFASEFEELQALRADLRSCFSELRGQSLPAGVTQRIVAAVKVEADRSRESTTPALSRDDEQDSGRAKPRWIAAVLALAASVAVVVGIWSRDKTQSSSMPSLIAQLDPEKPLEPEKQSSPLVAATPIVVPTRDSAESVPVEPMPEMKPVASDVESIAAVVPASPDSRPKVMGIKPEALATSDSKLTAEPAMTVDAGKPDVKRSPLAVVLMFSVELTQSGSDEDALDEALRASGIRLDKDSAIGADVVSQLKTASVIKASVEAEGSATSKLYFVEASAKQLDRFMINVLSDSRSFGTVGMSLVLETPLLASVGDLRVIDPTKVRQDAPTGIARGLVAAEGVTWSANPDSFAPLSRDDVAESGVMQLANQADIGVDPNGSASTGEDFPAQMLLLVK